MKTFEILQQAEKLVNGDRDKTHGDKLENHKNISLLWSAYLETTITPKDVAILMVLLKLARTKAGQFNIDDYVDACGYSAIAGELKD
ncbi:MAG: DUF6378 domain-containing protein [bacterium]|nr:DUF6378 domain-containing protein [bacterium]